MPPIKGDGWIEIFTDYFEENVLSPVRWPTRSAAPSTNITGSFYIQNRELVIEINNTGTSGVTYLAINCGSQNSFQYGWFEIDCRLPHDINGNDSGPGIWDAWWAFSDKSGLTGSAFVEIDGFETLHETPKISRIHFHNWYPSHTSNNVANITGSVDWSQTYHRYAWHYYPYGIDWYIDDELVASFPTGVASIPIRIMIQNQNDYSMQWSTGPTAATKFPNYFRVRSVRVWQQNLWHGFQLVTYTGTLSGAQTTRFQNAIQTVLCRVPRLPQMKTIGRQISALSYLVESSAPQPLTRHDWATSIFQDVYDINLATFENNLVVTTYTGTFQDSARQAKLANNLG